MELTRGTLTTIFATSSGFKGLVAIRFCIDLAEAPPYPAIQYAIGSWRKSDELAKEACLFQACSVSEVKVGDSLIASQTASSIGPIISGFLQAVAPVPFSYGESRSPKSPGRAYITAPLTFVVPLGGSVSGATTTPPIYYKRLTFLMGFLS